MKTITIDQNTKTKELGDLFGLFFEDINHAADGGLYAELIQNRSFEYDPIDNGSYNSLTAWENPCNLNLFVSDENPMNGNNRHYLVVDAQAGSCIRNTGYNSGIYIEAGEKYDFSIFVRNSSGSMRVYVEDEDAVCTDIKKVKKNSSSDWIKYEAVLSGKQTTVNGRFVIEFDNDGRYEFDMVSLFPENTFKNRKSGLRKDIAEALADMHPKFMRFPGGCLTHDGNLDENARNSMYRWRRTIGEVHERPTWRNNWGYNQTLGLGYFEYFQFCEDIGCKPLPVVPGGFNPHKGEGVPIEEISYWVKETLDLCEFALGDTTTEWGKKRAELGHPAPFNLEYIGIGNEEIGNGFFERYPFFHKAIREKYPDIKIINSAGPFAVGEGTDAGWSSAKKYGSDLVDEHYYSSPEWFLANMHHYDDYDPNGPKVFLGEYASWGNTFYNALTEAAYMTHLEKAPSVSLACYAPMLCNVDYVNWAPDMLWFNNHEIMKTPNYYVQKMFMQAQGDEELNVTTQNLDEIIPMYDDVRVKGDIAICGNDVKGKIWDVCVTDDVTGEAFGISEIDIAENNELRTIKKLDTDKFTLSFKFRRTAGRKGLKIFFGKKNPSNFLMWEFGGWDNWDCNITSTVSRRGSTISHRIFHVEDIPYELKLVVDGRHITTYINGVLYNDTVDHLPELEELYVAASADKDGKKTFLKVVNMTGEDKSVTLRLLGKERSSARITELSSGDLSASNSLENKDVVVPKMSELPVMKDYLDYTFPAHSVTVMELV